MPSAPDVSPRTSDFFPTRLVRWMLSILAAFAMLALAACGSAGASPAKAKPIHITGVPTAGVRYVVIPFADMAAALKAHRVDAINEVEPFLSSTEDALGAQPVLQQCTGPTAGIPLGGYITTAAWAAGHLAAARAFARAVEQGQALAASDRAAVEKVLPCYMPISESIAALVNLNTFPTSVSLVQLQRVADLMQAGGMLRAPPNVTPLVLR